MEKVKPQRTVLACTALVMNGVLMLYFAVVNNQDAMGTENVLWIFALAALTVLSAAAYYWVAYQGRKPRNNRIPFSFAIMFQYLPLWGVSFCLYRHVRRVVGALQEKDVVYIVMLATAGLVLLICVSYLVLAMRGMMPQGGKGLRSHGRL